jgi:hypothetical protein
MRVPMLSLSLLFLSIGCAGMRAPSHSNGPVPLARGDTRWDTCFPGRSYSDDDTALMQQMLDEGVPAKQIAAKLGGKPQDIRCWQARINGRWHDSNSHVASVASK